MSLSPLIAIDVDAVLETASKITTPEPVAPRRRAPPLDLVLWGVPRAYCRAMPGRSDEAAAQAVDAWDCQTRPLLVLSGARGVGKSHAAARWLWHRYPLDPPRRREERRWWDAREVQMLGRYDLAAHRELVGLPLLVIDDLGAEPGDEDAWWRSRIELTITRRAEDLRPTCVSTNLCADDLRERYGERLYDRLRHRASWVEVSGANLRHTTA